jgi:hypothetical protein
MISPSPGAMTASSREVQKSLMPVFKANDRVKIQAVDVGSRFKILFLRA